MSILIKLFITFFKIGLCTFGGGYAMLPMIRQEVLSNGWMIEDELIDFLAISESTPAHSLLISQLMWDLKPMD